MVRLLEPREVGRRDHAEHGELVRIEAPYGGDVVTIDLPIAEWTLASRATDRAAAMRSMIKARTKSGRPLLYP